MPKDNAIAGVRIGMLIGPMMLACIAGVVLLGCGAVERRQEARKLSLQQLLDKDDPNCWERIRRNYLYWEKTRKEFSWQYDRGDMVRHKADGKHGIVLYRRVRCDRRYDYACPCTPRERYQIRFGIVTGQVTSGMAFGGNNSTPVVYVSQWINAFELVPAKNMSVETVE